MSEKLSYLYGFVHKKDLFYVAAQEQDETDLEHTLIFQFEGDEVCEWEIDAESVSMNYFNTVGKGLVGIVICTNGEVMVDDSQGQRWETIYSGEGAPNSMRALLASRVIGQKLYVTGMLRQVFARDNKTGVWSRIDQGLLPGSVEDMDVGFEDIDGFSEKEIYAVGLKGQIWMFDGENWNDVCSPTNRNLASLKCSPDGQVYVVGDGGIILRGRGKSWEVIEQELSTESFTCIEYAFGSLFIAENGSKLYKYFDDILTEVKMNLNKEVTTYHLHSNDGLLLSVGEEDVVLFDGNKWTQVQET